MAFWGFYDCALELFCLAAELSNKRIGGGCKISFTGEDAPIHSSLLDSGMIFSSSSIDSSLKEVT